MAKYQRYISFIILLLVITLFYACSSGGSDDSGPPVNNDIIPTNINLSVDIVGSSSATPNGNGSGQVNVQVTATNAVRYEIKFGNNNAIQSNDGISSHVFSEDGTNSFLISAFAYSSTDNSVSTFVTISVFFNADGTQLIWSDEFDEAGAPNSAKWDYNLGAGGWGNGEAQYYTDRSDNVIVEGGLLKIISKKESFSGSEYTSARIKTEGKFDFKYGKVEIRAKLPGTQGTWPALWMLGANFNSVGWPLCGEIDIMEQTGWDKNKVLATCHWLNQSDSSNASYGLDVGVSNATSSFHIYSLEWTETSIKMFVDDIEYYVLDLSSSLPFNKEFFLIFNVAIGGSLGGTIDPAFTQDTMEIDYVRVYQ